MGDEHERTGELGQALFEHVQGGDVEVVGGLVQEQDVGRPEHQPGQQDARLLAAGETLHRRFQLIRAKEEPLGPADHVHALALVEDAVALRGQGAPQGHGGVQLFAALIEADDANLVGKLDGAPVGRTFFRVAGRGEEPHQGGLAAAVAAEQAEPGARTQGQVQIGEQRCAAVALGQAGGGEQFFRFPAGAVEADAHLAGGTVAFAYPGEGLLQPPGLLDPVAGLGGAGLGAAAQPFGLPPQPVGQPFLQVLPLEQEIRLFFQKIGVTAAHLEGAVGVDRRQFDHPVDGVLEEATVMADHEQSGRAVGRRGQQQVLQPEDALDIQVVGRLVHDEHVRASDQGPAHGQPFAPAAGQLPHRLLRVVEMGAAEHCEHPAETLGLVEFKACCRGKQVVGAVGGLVEQVLLGDVGGARQLLQGDRAAVGGLQPAEDTQQGRLARAVRPDQPDPVAAVDAQVDAGEQGLGAEGLGHSLAAEQSAHTGCRAATLYAMPPLRLMSSARG